MRKFWVGFTSAAIVAGVVIVFVLPRLAKARGNNLELRTEARATGLARARAMGVLGGRDFTINELISANYVSQQIIEGLIALEAPPKVEWSSPGANFEPHLLDRNGQDADVLMSSEPARFGSLVLLPMEVGGALNDWSLVVLAGKRPTQHLVVFLDSHPQWLADEDFSAALADLNRQRAERKLAQIPDPRQLPDRLNH